MKYLIVTYFCLLTALSSCQFFEQDSALQSEEKTIWVNSFKKDCVGVAPTSCLLIQDKESIDEEAWEYLYDPIKGFTFEPGNIYRLKVRIDKSDPSNVPADASAWTYNLLEVLSKENDKRLLINDIWALGQMNNSDIVLADEKHRPVIEFHLADSRVLGNAGCNQMFGKLRVYNDHTLEMKEIGRTKMACADIEMEDTYLSLLEQSRSYAIQDLKLMLFDDSGETILQFRKID